MAGEFSPEPVGITEHAAEREPSDSRAGFTLLGLKTAHAEPHTLVVKAKPSQHSHCPTAAKETEPCNIWTERICPEKSVQTAPLVPGCC